MCIGLLFSGKDICISFQVDGKMLPCKPNIKWFKGKWLELGIKSGLRFQFKDIFDKEKNVSLSSVRKTKKTCSLKWSNLFHYPVLKWLIFILWTGLFGRM